MFMGGASRTVVAGPCAGDYAGVKSWITPTPNVSIFVRIMLLFYVCYKIIFFLDDKFYTRLD